VSDLLSIGGCLFVHISARRAWDCSIQRCKLEIFIFNYLINENRAYFGHIFLVESECQCFSEKVRQ